MPIFRRLVIVASAVALIESFFSAVLTPLVTSYRQELGLSEGAMGLLVVRTPEREQY